MKTFDDMIGTEVKFYGVNCNCFKIGKQVFEAIEDESDGYRSYLQSVEITKDELVFPRRMLSWVKILEWEDDYDGNYYKFTDVKDGHVWLRFGTNTTDDYYPWFYFEYQPKEAKK
jgi:hypothetical protein